MASIFHLPFLFIVSFAMNKMIFNTTAAAHVSRPKINATFPAVFAFGDSILDSGNNNFITTLVKCDFPPYGRDFITGKPTGRFGNGKLIIDFLVEWFGIKDTLPPFLDRAMQTEDLATGVSFASGGSGFDPLTSKIMSVIPMHEQLELFIKYKAELQAAVGFERAAAIVANSLYIVTAGSDDIVNTYFHANNFRRKKYTVSNYTDFLSSSASSFFEELHGLGARHINFLGLSSLGCLPIVRTVHGGLGRQCVTKYNDAAQLFNKKLKPRFEHLNRVFPSANFVFVDVYDILLDMIQNPHKYRFEVSDRGCCGFGLVETIIFCNRLSPHTCSNASQYLFWDSYHPTEKGYEIITNHIIGKLR